MTDAIPTKPGGSVAERRWLRYLLAHWRGEHSLGRSFWINTIAVTMVLLVLLATAVFGPPAVWPGLGYYAELWLILGGTLIGTPITLWQTVGLWRSSRNALRAGQRVWPRLARAFVVGAILLVGYDLSTGDHLEALRSISFLNNARSELKVSGDGLTLTVRGMIGPDFASRLERALAARPSVEVVELDSPGGLLAEAEEAAERVRHRRLTTRTGAICASACTILFLAGRERVLVGAGRLGFHAERNLVPGQAMDQAQFGAIYARAGLPAPFIRRVLDTPHDSIWAPSIEELREAGVISRHEPAAERAPR
jgi:membrane-bound ClpP family serine protease